ncbi:uncharacterized protein LOC132735591 isoform X2 [Ruditapes philippinarum]|uniref:uncharacterized protein LOC132735591 isoform X2 n=1 Tax=Ruditapes philippinarum TaxID=129788 RepID=UPI00295B5F82|nr:uncharacterized protein LOC132735591 isoform X2 [Ruditapes philippinarum]
MTVGRKLSTTRLSNERNFIFNGQMLEQELKPFTEFETSRALRRISEKSEKELSDRVCSDIHALCGGIPFSVRVVGDLLKNGFTPEKLLSGLQRQPQSVPMDVFLQKSFQMLESTPSIYELKGLLVRFSVFQTARFNINAAVAVGFNTSRDEEFRRPLSLSSLSGRTITDETVKNEMELKLQQLKCHFLLEVDDAQSSLGRKRAFGEKLFSLHPLVANYIMSLCKEDENLRMERESARSQFLQYYGSFIESLGKRCDSDLLISRNMMEASMIHIKQFFTIIREEKFLLTQYLPQKDPNKHKRSAKVAVQRRHIWKIAEWAISSSERTLFARRQAELEHDRKKLFSYIYWKSLEAESLLIQDRIQLTLQLLKSVTSELKIVRDDTVCSKVDGWVIVPDEEMITWATFYTVKGRLYFKKSRHNNEKVLQERAMNILTLAENLLEGKDKSCKGEDLKKYFKIDLAEVKNLKGCVYFLMKDYNKSRNCHETAYNLVLKLTGNQLHKNLTEYRSNVASCYYQSALDANDQMKRDELFQKALKYYAMSVRDNQKINCEMMPSQAGTLRNRAEIYYKQDRLENALEDGKHVLTIVRNLYVAPHIEITLAIERLAYYHFKLWKKKQKDLDGEGQTHLEKAMKLYDEVLMQITNGGLPLEYNDTRTYRNVRENHMKVMRLLRYEGRLFEDRLRQYQGFEEGKYNKKIHHNLQHDLDFVPEEFLKKAIAEGAKFVPHKMEDSDDISSESGWNKANPVSSISSSNSTSERAQSPNRMMDIDQVVALKRQDSGLEEAEMSDEELKGPQKELNDMEVDKRDVKPSIVDNDHDAVSKRKMLRKRSSVHVSSKRQGVAEGGEVKEEIGMIKLQDPSQDSVMSKTDRKIYVRDEEIEDDNERGVKSIERKETEANKITISQGKIFMEVNNRKN